MPKSPQGVIGCAVTVAKVATGELQDISLEQPAKRKSDLAGAKVRVEFTTLKGRSEIAHKAASARWK